MSLQFERVDVLIVGAGLAAVTVALHLPHSLNVLVVSKHEVTSANSDLAQGGIASSYLEPSSVDHERDTLVASKLAAVPDRVYTLVEEGRSAIRDLERFGVVFDREGAEYAVGREGAHGMNRIFHVGGDETGRHVMATLRRQLPDNVTVMEHVLIDSLVKTDDRVTGATGFNGKTRLHVQAGAVVLATGGIGGLIDWTSNCRSVTGDGLVLADEVGARLKNLSRIQFHPTLLAVDSPHLVTEALRGAGATLVDASGRHVMAHHPLGSLAPRDEVARSLTRHDGTVYLDTSRVERIDERFPKLVETCRMYGLDATRILVRPGLHFHMGGVDVDVDGRTTVAGLYAVGEVADSGVHGKNRLASNSLLECWVFGKRVAAAVMVEEKPFTVNETTVYDVSDDLFSRYRQQIGEWLTISPQIGEIVSFLENTQQLAQTKHVSRQLSEQTLSLKAARLLASAVIRTEDSDEQNRLARTADSIFT
ncbi:MULTISPECIES: L-aspartate oxidase [unclassified Exiguobacterium]|uniref:L-aspartate oxidase n=1 Tax=unclassified Exiguobacterium TaxID=2644629 RepID=UPI001BE8AB03|nr:MULTISPECIES: FAD-dependent oxidoreductase [unclassified Exiguobacterium]